ncbi:MAG: uracil-DNA glycosylase family protein [Alphaproteobacteria bacterium]
MWGTECSPIFALPHEPRPVLRVSSTARLCVCGQAPGTRVHASGKPFTDPSGDRLRAWMGVTAEEFYDAYRVAIVPMGFCYPGRGKSGDLPPRKECAPQWHKQILSQLPNIELTLLVGQYAQSFYLSDKPKTLTETVHNWQRWAPAYFPLPHPSPRNSLWLKKNSWFEDEVLGALRERVDKVR